ncbi:hypothetical protein EJ04DRAFT_570315 [Polyplosphaeria fusca]|uniref:M6 metalloprotease n=1 Tax=Polyplosphaeria fusca TaxID=682080 RepID=A0A9P4QL76_9PLEO|nr:hypothetical protein EJ04DRAFT_570315 [Polyplosphaeria fusca]
MSYGKLSLELVPVLDQWYRMPAESSSYNYSRGLTTELHLKYINDALTAVGPSFSFENIDVLYVIAAPYADEIGFSTSTSVDVIAADGSTIGISITYGQDLHFTWGYKTINHETGHAMGLPDLYAEEDNTKYVGGFDLMGLIAGQSPDYFAWHKWQLGWVDDSQVECAVDAGKTTYRIGPIEVAGEAAKAVAIPITSTQYVMAEVRSTLGIDSDACGTGVLLYTADSAIGSGDGPVRIIDANENSGGCKPDVGGEMNDAPFGVEQVWAGEGVTVRVVEKVDDDYIIEVERAE